MAASNSVTETSPLTEATDVLAAIGLFDGPDQRVGLSATAGRPVARQWQPDSQVRNALDRTPR